MSVVDSGTSAAGRRAVIPEGVYSELVRIALSGGPSPVYLRLAEAIGSALGDGRIPDRALLISEQKLSARIGVSPSVVNRAVSHLVSRGSAVRERGVGTVLVAGSVAPTGIAERLEHAGGLVLACRADIDLVEAGAAAPAGFDPTTGLSRITRTLTAAGSPVAVLVSWIPFRPERIAPAMIETSGLYPSLALLNAQPAQCVQEIRYVADDGRRPRLAAGPQLRLTRRTTSTAGRLVEVAEHFYLASEFAVRQTLVA